jgi:hypothetical protein
MREPQVQKLIEKAIDGGNGYDGSWAGELEEPNTVLRYREVLLPEMTEP